MKNALRGMIIFLSLVLLISAVSFHEAGSLLKPYDPIMTEKALPAGAGFGGNGENTSLQKEMRGVWIPFMALELTDGERAEDTFDKKVTLLLNECKDAGANTVIVHVRPFSDAIYPSKLYPMSHVISGSQGETVDFDPLERIIDLAHNRKLNVHAWINPLRISTGQTPDELSADNPYFRMKDIGGTFTFKGGIYYDPSLPEVRRLIIDGVRELAENYDIDGVQIDDYFYPVDDEGNAADDYDNGSYEKYLGTLNEGALPLSKEEWREANINMLVAGMYDAVHTSGKEMVFGISPQGNFENDKRMSADVISWGSVRGYADYLCPQLYVSMEHPVLPFAGLADRWTETVTLPDIALYFGLGLYKAGTDADGGTWKSREDNIVSEIEYGRKKKAGGFMLYSCEYLKAADAQKEMKRLNELLSKT